MGNGEKKGDNIYFINNRIPFCVISKTLLLPLTFSVKYSILTRFFILSKEEKKNDGEKCSIVFSTPHKAGTLFRVLEVFAKQNINLTRIESIPSDPGDYAFFLDFVGNDKDERVVKALAQAKEIAANFKILGCYKERSVE